MHLRFDLIFMLREKDTQLDGKFSFCLYKKLILEKSTYTSKIEDTESNEISLER